MADPLIEAETASTRPSIAVLPFAMSGDERFATIADALPHDLIVELSRLRWLFVIARGSSFQFRGPDADHHQVRSALNVRYLLTGAVRVFGDKLTVNVELCDARDGAVLWGERYDAKLAAVHEIRSSIANSVVTALELQIPANEAKRALDAPDNLDAWAAYHLGIHHMYRFSKEGNDLATHYFHQAVGATPGFARAYAGLSFAHFENAFLRVSDNPKADAQLARQFAEKGLEHDALDPFCNLVMGRVSWLEGELEAALPWLDRATELNSNYAQAKYSRSFTETLLGDGARGRLNADAAIELSPLDPLLYGMLGVKALSYIIAGEPAQGVIWAERAARTPRAHPLIEMIAAVAHGLDGDDARARMWAESARRRNPRITSTEFLGAFPFADGPVRARVLAVLSRLRDLHASRPSPPGFTIPCPRR